MKFKFRTPIPKTVVLLALLLTSCGRGVLDMQIVPPEQATQQSGSTSSGSGRSDSLSAANENLPNEALAPIQMVALSFLAGNAEDRQSLIKYQTAPCSNQPDSGLPICLTGEKEGQELQVFPLGDNKLAYLRLEDIRRQLDFQVKDLYAVVSIP